MSQEQISITGNVANAPVVRYTQTGKAVANFAVYENGFAKGDNAKVQRVSKRTRVTAWEDLATACSECLTKGCKVTVKGILKPRSWTDSKGVEHNEPELVLRSIEQQ